MNSENPVPFKNSDPQAFATAHLDKRNMDEKEVPSIFSQMNIFYKDLTISEWRESARWLKYEENVEEFCKRWSKPHVSSHSGKYVLELKRLLRSAHISLDLEASNLNEIIDHIVKAWTVHHSNLDQKMTERLWDVLLARHKHAHLTRKDMKRYSSSATESKGKNRWRFGEIKVIEMKMPSIETTNLGCIPFANNQATSSDPNAADVCNHKNRENSNMVRKIGKDVKICNILVGEVSGLYEPLVSFVRLQEAIQIADMCEIRRPTKFLFVILCPDKLEEYKQIGRIMGSMMTSKSFREVACFCDNEKSLICAVENFLAESTLLPCDSWDPNIRLVPPATTTKVQSEPEKSPEIGPDQDSTENVSSDEMNLYHSGRLFGGLINDFKQKSKWYWSDFTDSMHLQCFATTIYIFLATLSPNVTFGGLLGQATDYNMAAIECLLAASITGVVFALFSGQPLNILGSTGPMLIMETILYSFCKDYGWDFMSIRVWIGLWTFLILMLIVAFDLSVLIRYVTRFTEETFACLIALIFIFEAHVKMIEISSNYPVNRLGPRDFVCIPGTTQNHNSQQQSSMGEDDQGSFIVLSESMMSTKSEISALTEPTPLWKEVAHEAIGINSTVSPFFNLVNSTGKSETSNDCDHCAVEGPYIPDVFLLSVILFVGTFILARGMDRFRTSGFFPQIIRRTVSDFGVLISIFCMVAIDYYMGLETPKLIVPSEFKPTRSDRGWIINPFSEKNPKWLPLAGCIPAVLSALLIFMDQQITAVIVNRKENKLKKGGGYHLDLAVVAVLIAVCSILGLPWYVAATVSAIVHIMALRKESDCVAPGEPISFNGVREQRVTALLVGILNGVSVLFTSVLQYIPMPVLYGVFLYMGVTSLSGMQLIDRTLILFKPVKYQPDYPYLRHVAIHKVHVFTIIQIVCLILLWIIKSIKSISILFPLMVIALCFIRKLLDCVYTARELDSLDSILPSSKSNSQTNDIETVRDVNNPAFIGSTSEINEKLSNQKANLVFEYNKKSSAENNLDPKLASENTNSQQTTTIQPKQSKKEESRKKAMYVSQL